MNKLQKEKVFGILETFGINTGAITESKVRLSKELKDYVIESYNNKTKKYTYQYADNATYTLEKVNNNYVLTRNVAGFVKRVFLEDDEIALVENKEITEEVMKELVELVDFIKQRIGL